jgi:hypothetical protein
MSDTRSNEGFRPSDDQDVQIEEDEEVFELSNLLAFLQKTKIAVNGIFTYDNRTVFLLLMYLNTGVEFLLYIPSRFNIKADKSISNYTHVNLMIEEEDEEAPTSNHVASYEQESRRRTENMLSGFIKIIKEGTYKMAVIQKTYMSYISRHDAVESYIFINPFVTTGVYFIIDLEMFYKMASSFDRDLLHFEQLFTNKILSNVDVQINSIIPTLNKMYSDIKNFSSRTTSSDYTKRIDRLSNLMLKYKGQRQLTQVYQLMSQARTDNLKKLIYLEEFINFLKDMKDVV